MTQASQLRIDGICDPTFAEVSEEFEKNFLARNEIG